MAPKNTINAYILAGGKSSRMGTDKGLLMINDMTITEHILQAIKPEVDRVSIISDNEAYAQFGFKVLPDKIKGIGPAGGIYTALCDSAAEKILVMSCDMPFVSSNAVKCMIDNSGTHQITVPVYKSMLEPMLGVYSLSCKEKWEELINKGIFKLQTLFSHFDTHELIVDDKPAFNEIVFTNINTAMDLNKAKKLL